jgi:hypothetical protein
VLVLVGFPKVPANVLVCWPVQRGANFIRSTEYMRYVVLAAPPQDLSHHSLSS